MIVSKYIDLDTNFFKTQVGNYKNYLNYLKNPEKHQDEDFRDNPKKYSLNMDNLECLKYKSIVAAPEVKKEADFVDVY